MNLASIGTSEGDQEMSTVVEGDSDGNLIGSVVGKIHVCFKAEGSCDPPLPRVLAESGKCGASVGVQDDGIRSLEGEADSRSFE